MKRYTMTWYFAFKAVLCITAGVLLNQTDPLILAGALSGLATMLAYPLERGVKFAND